MTSRAWLCDPTDPRVVAALTRKCSACGTGKGDCCRMLGQPLVGGRIIHEIRVPDAVIFAADLDHLPVEEVRG